MLFKEYDVNSFEKNGTKYAVVSIPYKNETATMTIPFFIQTQRNRWNDFL